MTDGRGLAVANYVVANNTRNLFRDRNSNPASGAVGAFSRDSSTNLRDLTDGSSNTILMGERVRPVANNAFGEVAEETTGMPLACRALLLPDKSYATTIVASGDTAPGFRWADGAAFFCGFTTILPPNSASCGTIASEGHWSPGMFAASSRHAPILGRASEAP